MQHPVIHFEIIGPDPDGLRDYYQQLFGWHTETGDATTPTVSDPGAYHFIHGSATGGINGGIGGGSDFEPRVVFYVNVTNVESALADAERLGGTRRMGPEGTPGTLVVGQFTDPQGNLIGVAGIH